MNMQILCGTFGGKKRLAALFFLAAVALGGWRYLSAADSAAAGDPQEPGKQIIVRYSFQQPSVAEADGLALLHVPGLSLLVEEGKPIIPFKTARILLPPSGTVSFVDVRPSEQKTLPGQYQLEQGRAPQPTRAAEAIRSIAGPPEFAENKPFPGRFYDLTSVQKLCGYRIAILRLYPVQYVAATGQVTYYETLTVAVSVSSPTGEAAKPTVPSLFRGYSTDEARVTGIVDNRAMLRSYPRPEKTRWEKAQSINAKDATEQSAKSTSCQYLIITKPSYVSKFQPLLEWKMQRGLTGRIATVAEIEEEYDGEDLQERIRNFIRESYAELGTEYVLLGGDTEIIPARGVYGEVGSYIDERIPCDMYYACLDGTWEDNGNGIYGEGDDGEDGGEIDLVAEVYVGRAPVSNPYEAENFVMKTLRYEVQRSPNLSRALWVGQSLDSKTWGSDSKEELVPLLPASFEVTRLYQKQGTYSAAAVIEELNNSPHIVNHLGHSTEHDALGLSQADVDDLENDHPFFLYSQGCDIGAFDFDDSVAEHFVKNERAAFALIANSRYGWYSPETTLGTSQKFDRAFIEAVFSKGITHLGAALQESKEANIGEVLLTGSARWCYFELNLLGDPETPLFTATSMGLVSFDQPWYSPRTPMRLSLSDMDLNVNPLVTEVAAITLRSPRDVETIFALETSSNSGVFAAEVPLSTGTPVLDGLLQVKDGDTAEAIYEDADDGSGSPRTATATARIDDSAPIISDVKIADVRDTWAVIEWKSNEMATARVDYGVSLPLTSSAFSDVQTNYHRVVVSGLEKETVYTFRVAAIDLVGNETVDDNGGEYYSFQTKHQIVLFSDDVEEGSASAAGEWSFQVISGGVSDWQITVDDFRSETSCWHTDDYPLPSANVLDTPPIDLRGATTAQLSFWHRMLSESDWDGGFVQLQREGTQDWVSLIQEQMTEGTPFVTLSTGNPSGPVPGWSGDIPWERVTFDLSEFVGSKAKIRFRMESDDNTDAGEGDGWYIDDIAVLRVVGTVSFDKLFYKLSDTVVITVLDVKANTDPEVAEQVSVEVSSTVETVPEIVILTETGPDSSMFVGQIVIAKGKKPDDGQLGVSDHDTITACYGGTEIATALTDLTSPTITEVKSTQVADTSALITWKTDELCRGKVYYGMNPAALDRVASQVVGNVIHELRLTELEPRSTYYFKVEVVDRGGNTSMDDNSGRLYSFLTLGFAQAGVIAEDTVWRYVEGGPPYVINGSVYVGSLKSEEPVTLTIEPGVVVQFRTDKKDLFVRGGLVARGVTFEFELSSGKSAHIIFEEGSWGILDNSVVSVSGSSLELSGGIECYSSQVQFTNNIVRNAYYGIHCLSSSPRISGNSFIICNYGVFLHAAAERYCSPEVTENTFMACRSPIFCEASSYPVVSDNAFIGNTYDGLVQSVITQDTIWPAYDCPQYIGGDLTVPADRTLWIAPGATVRFGQPGADLFISGNLYAKGATIEFAVPPEPFTFLTFASTSSGSVRNCRIVGTSPDGLPTGGIKCQSSSVSFTGNVISNTYYGIFCGPSKTPLIANNTIVGCRFGVYAPDAAPKVTNCILWDNGDDLVGCTGTFLDIMDGDVGKGNICLDPLFCDPAARDFRLQPGSPCIDSGTSEGTPLLDALGYLRWDDPAILNTGEGSQPYFDIGAHEFVFDADEDFICDAWEVENSLDPSDRTDASEDADGDGRSNLDEYVSGTDPHDPSSCLQVVALELVHSSFDAESEGTVIVWASLEGRSYTVFYADELAPTRGRRATLGDSHLQGSSDLTMWKVCSDVIEGTNGHLSFLDEWSAAGGTPLSPVPTRRFYRVEVR
jgi:parallel beta-helix repeat protein